MNGEMEGNWKESVVAMFKVIFQHLLGASEENHKIVSQYR
jgi:hypothetical protein